MSAIEAAVLLSDASVLAGPAAAAVVLLAPTSTAANDTLLAKGIPIDRPCVSRGSISAISGVT